MSQIDQVLALARSLQLAGKQPSIALLKAKLKSVPMPALVQGLQKYKSLSEEELAALVPQLPEPQAPASSEPSEAVQIAQLHEQLNQLQADYQALALRVAELERNH